ncbi:hypothetical protein DDZ18_03840 [Marinicauda salina]|uniref:Sulfotransferase family protein n=1 Tax=Marinicauda salina TaxID=2135793 RepID=A0A2U2BXN8_9PROT|nr:sulfotransferase family 2 domain-containing protein [Marinicauda salina]PWE18734.1 hypothetical protein DDZ18_03840 [Marinicauda salina]
MTHFVQLHTRNSLDAFRDAPDNLVFVHIGKCGGASVWDGLQRSQVIEARFSEVGKVHFAKPRRFDAAKLLFLVRNPIERTISAFNWRRKLVVDEAVQKDRFAGEYDVIVKYGSINALAEALYTDAGLDPLADSDFQTIHHLKEDIAHYLADLVGHASRDQIVSVMVTDYLNAYMKRVFGLDDVKRLHENRPNAVANDAELSERARANLRRYLQADYAVIKRLRERGFIDSQEFEMLMR